MLDCRFAVFNTLLFNVHQYEVPGVDILAHQFLPIALKKGSVEEDGIEFFFPKSISSQ